MESNDYYFDKGILKFSVFKKFPIIKAGFSTSELGNPGYGNSTTASRLKSRKRVLDIDGLSIYDGVFQDQQHTAQVRIVGELNKHYGVKFKKNAIQYNDGMATNEKNVVLTVWGADCTPVYLFDPIKNVIGVFHSGREGTRKNITTNMIDLIVETYQSNPSDIISILGPSICEKCYQINEDIASKFSGEYITRIDDKVFLNVKAKIRNQLLKSGIEKIIDIPICTFCDKRFFSYRREGKKHGTAIGYIVLR